MRRWPFRTFLKLSANHRVQFYVFEHEHDNDDECDS